MAEDAPKPADERRLEMCLDLFSRHQRRLFLYISAMVPSPADAEEVLQETNIVIWKKFGDFEPGTDFLTWAYRIAHYQVLQYRRKQGRDLLSFGSEVLDQIADAANAESAVLEERRGALATCVKKLAQDDRKLIERCYAEGSRVEAVAKRINRTPTSVYRSLRRIRRVLRQCINHSLSLGGTS